jgi:hypothetical protein
MVDGAGGGLYISGLNYVEKFYRNSRNARMAALARRAMAPWFKENFTPRVSWLIQSEWAGDSKQAAVLDVRNCGCD